MVIPEREVFVCWNLTRAAETTQEHVRNIYRERAVIIARWHTEGATYSEIADVLGMSRSRAQQIVESVRKENG
jgi:DNA-directed RNA polymerase specialized sigma subunit